jgi:serine/threonine-protein kinase
VIDSSRPTIAATSAGLVATWVDNHENERKKQGFSALLDNALRRVNEPLLVTPEAASVRHPQLAQLNDKLALLYWEDSGNEPGVYVRRLDAEGRIAGPARRVSATKRDQFYPALAAAGDAGFWAVWSEEHETGVEDLVGRRLGKEFEAIGPPVRLTRHVTTPGTKVSASKPDVAVAHGTLFVVYALETVVDTRPMLLRVRLDDPELGSAPGDPAIEKKRRRKGEWTVGTAKPIVPAAKGKNAQPRIACSTEGCFAAWDDETAGANLAFIDKDRGEVIWHREISRKGARPAVAVSGSSAAVAWYESSRVKIALISRDTLGDPSVLARVSGHQPYPAIAPGLEPGQWYISWRDYEAGHLEAFVVRAGCQ